MGRIGRISPDDQLPAEAFQKLCVDFWQKHGHPGQVGLLLWGQTTPEQLSWEHQKHQLPVNEELSPDPLRTKLPWVAGSNIYYHICVKLWWRVGLCVVIFLPTNPLLIQSIAIYQDFSKTLQIHLTEISWYLQSIFFLFTLLLARD